MCPLLRGSTVHKEEDNEMAGPNESFIQMMKWVEPVLVLGGNQRI